MKRSLMIVGTLLVALSIARMAGAGDSAETLAPLSHAASAALPAEEDAIAYADGSTGDIHVMSPDGTNDRLLWTNPWSGIEKIRDLAWRPDGRELAFSSSHEQLCSWYESDVYAIGSGGSGYRRITNGPACAALAGLPKGTVNVSVRNALSDAALIYVEGAPGAKTVAAWYEGTVSFDNVADLGPGVLQPSVGIAGLYRYPGAPAADVVAGQTVSGGSVLRDSLGGGKKGFGVGKVSWKADRSALAYDVGLHTAIRQIPASPPYGAIGVNLPMAQKTKPYAVAWGPTPATQDQYLYASDWDLLTTNVAGIYLNTVGNASGGTQLVAIEDLTGQTILDIEWLPDASGFLFSKRWVPLDISADIFEYSFATQLVTRVTPSLVDKTGYGGARGLSISPDGQQIVFERALYEGDAKPSVWIINRDGTGMRMLAESGGRPAWGRVAAPPPLRVVGYLPVVLRSFVAPRTTPTSMPGSTATSAPTRTPTPTWAPTDTPTPMPGNDGINGRVTYKGAAASGIELQLQFYDGSNVTTAATTATDGEGRYRFTAAASLASGQEYWVRFLSPGNPAYLATWQTASITAYTSGSSAPGGDFDIADVSLLSPPSGAAQALPVTFTWQPRGIPGDTYRVVIWDLDTSDYWYTADLGNVGSFTATGLWEGVVFGKAYGWAVWVFNGPDSFGQSYYYRAITFLTGGGGSAAALEAWQTGKRLREPRLIGTRR